MRFSGRTFKIKTFFNFLVLPASLALFLLVTLFLWSYISTGASRFSPFMFVAHKSYEITETADSTQGMMEGQHAEYPVSFLNDRARDITGAAAVNAPGFVVPGGLTGEGQLVAIADSGLDTGRLDDIHPDLQSTPGKMPKVVFLKSLAGRDVPDDPDGHGTHMAATIAGTGAASNGQFRGMAPDASIYFQAILNKDGEPELPKNLADLFLPAYSAGARVHVDGWGGGPDVYLDSASQVDDFVRNHPDFLVVFGAGNSGPSPGTITAEGNSKNALTVGASVLPRPAFVPGLDNTAASVDFSSRGPTGDGRIKPELLAPASAVISARSRLVEGNLPGYPAYTSMQGTSMAAAVAGGEAILLREYFKKYMNIFAPSATLVKAALINGSRSMIGGPSREGFGVSDLAGTVIALKDGAFRAVDESAGVSQGNESTYTFRVTDTSAPLKATLAWTDPTAEPGGAQVLVNDLDLIVQTPDGRVYYGNHFLGNNTPDRTNNVEQVYLPSPVPGDYTIRVIGANIRRNTVSGSHAASQDFALVWGQPPDESMVAKASSQSVVLDNGASFSPTGGSTVNLVDNRISPADADHLFPGAAAYRTPQRVYLVTRLWRATGVRALKTTEGTTFAEINPAKRVGGYTLAPDAGGVLLNNFFSAPERLPPGVEVNAVVNPIDQKIRQVRVAYSEQEGVVSAMRYEDGEKKIFLESDGGSYRISPDMAFSYEDNYTGVETKDMPFGTGALEELDEVLPGMPVRLYLAPSSGEVQYLAVKRRVALGTVRETKLSSGEINLENGTSFRLFPGALVKRDRESAGFDAIKQGDHVTAAILPDTGEAIGLVAYSKVLYGKAIDFTRKNGTLYLLDDSGNYRTFTLSPDAVIYRWGVKTTADAIAVGRRIRVTTDPAGKEVWQLDIADTFNDKGALASYNGTDGTVTIRGGEQFRVSSSTHYYKNGYPVLPGDFLPGEQLDLEYTTAPPPTGNVMLSVNARTTTPAPQLLFSALPFQGRLMVTGMAGANATVYVWGEDGSKLTVPVDGEGKFNCSLQQEGEEGFNFTLVTVDQLTKGVSGRKVTIPAGGVYGEDASSIVAEAMGQAVDQEGKKLRYSSETTLTRAETAAALARLFSWPKASESPLPFVDEEQIPPSFRPAVAEARAWGILKGYPDGHFLPMAGLSRTEAAMMLDALYHDFGLETKDSPLPPFGDQADIPSWALKAVAETTAAGLIPTRPDGAFAPGKLVTVGEMASMLERLLTACERSWTKN